MSNVRSKVKRSVVGSLALSVCLAAGAAGVAGAASATGSSSSFSFGAPIAGADRYATAVAAAEAAFPGGSSSVVIVNGSSTVDGLTAAYVAGLHGAPILYTTATATPDVTKAELAKLGAKSVYVVGGTSVVSQAQIDGWKSSGLGVTSYGGANRYATAAVAADAGGAQGTAFVASGDSAHLADALSIGAIAYQKHYPILLTRSTSVPAETSAELTKLKATPIVVGGATGVSDSTMTALGASTRLAGSNRSQTAAAVADWAIAHAGFVKTSVALVGSADANMADALVAAPLAAQNGVPMLFAGTADTNAYLAANSANYTGTGFVFGGPSAVSASAISTATSSVTTGAAPTTPSNSPYTTPTSSLTSLADAGTIGTIDSGDVIRIKFNTVLATPWAGAYVQIADGDTTSSVSKLVNGTNATFSLNGTAVSDGTAFNGAAAGTVLTITVTGAPTVVTAGTSAGVQTSASITGASGITNLAAGAWNVSGSLSGSAGTSAVQTLTVPASATGGTFSITGSSTVSGIAYNASTSTLAASIATAQGLSSSGLVTVTGPVSGVYTISYARSVGPVTTLTTSSSLTAATPTVTKASSTSGVAGVADVQTITFTGGTASTGSFTLHGSAGTSSATISSAGTAAEIAAAVNQAEGTSITASNVSGAGSAPATASSWVITFPQAPQTLLTVGANSLQTSGSGTVTPSIAHTTTGVTPVGAVATLTVPTTATGGNYTVSGANSTSGSVAYNASAASVEAAVETAVFGTSTGTAVTVGGPTSGVYTLTFAASAGTTPNSLAVASTSLTGSTPTTSVASATTGVLGVSGLTIG